MCALFANINGSPSDKDGDCFLPRLSLSGEVLDLEWLKGLDAPKDMAIAGNTLYVSDIDRIVTIDITVAMAESLLLVMVPTFHDNRVVAYEFGPE